MTEKERFFTGPADLEILRSLVGEGWTVEEDHEKNRVTFELAVPYDPIRLHKLTRQAAQYMCEEAEHEGYLIGFKANKIRPCQEDFEGCFTLTASWPLRNDLVAKLGQISGWSAEVS